MYPESRPKEKDPEKALAQGLKISQLRMAGWTNPKTNGKNGLFVEDDWKNLGDFLLREKQITQPVPTSRMYTNDFINEINTIRQGSCRAAGERVRSEVASTVTIKN